MVKLDMMTMLFRQWEWSKGIYDNCFIYLGWDASPQLGYDYYVVRETIVTMSEISRDDPNPLRVGAVRGQHRIKPITILGWGETAIEQKLVRLIHSIRLESGLAYDKYRHRVRGNYKDQGSSDRSLGSAPNLEGDISDTIRGLQNGDIKLGGCGGWRGGFPLPARLGVPRSPAHLLQRSQERANTQAWLEGCGARVSRAVSLHEQEGASVSLL